jgi:hypothetical protein
MNGAGRNPTRKEGVTIMALLTASYKYSGLPDYWGGNSRRWDDDAGCVFAYYGRNTTLRDIIDGAVDDFCMGGDCDSFDEEVTDSDVRAALLACLSDVGRADYESGAVSEFAESYADANGPPECRCCTGLLGYHHEDDCPVLGDLRDENDDPDGDYVVEEEDCEDEDDCSDSPFVVFLLECNRCDECNELADVDELGCCAACVEKGEG